MKFNLMELLVVISLVAFVLLGTVLSGGKVNGELKKVKAASPAKDLEKICEDAYEGGPRKAKPPAQQAAAAAIPR